MNIQCPNCETVFEIDKKENSNKKYKCSVCNHIWIESAFSYENAKKGNDSERANLKKILLLNIIICLLVIFVFIIFRNNLENVDNNWKNLYTFFDMLIPIQ